MARLAVGVAPRSRSAFRDDNLAVVIPADLAIPLDSITDCVVFPVMDLVAVVIRVILAIPLGIFCVALPGVLVPLDSAEGTLAASVFFALAFLRGFCVALSLRLRMIRCRGRCGVHFPCSSSSS